MKVFSKGFEMPKVILVSAKGKVTTFITQIRFAQPKQPAVNVAACMLTLEIKCMLHT